MNMNDKKLKEQDSNFSKRIVALLVKQLQIFAVCKCIQKIKIQEIHTLLLLRDLSFLDQEWRSKFRRAGADALVN